MTILQIHTDGGCRSNQQGNNIGGWGAILQFGEHTKELYGGELNTTNNRMEMTALLEAFRSIKKPNQQIEVFSDSSYLINCFRDKWYIKWIKKNWMMTKTEPVKNAELWQALLPFLDAHNITFYRVTGHINLNHPSTNIPKHFNKFQQLNGDGVTFQEFEHAVRMNNRADELANIAMDELQTNI